MNRLAGIVVAVIGLLVAVVSVLGVVPGLTATGVIVILLGGLIIGLSFIDKPDPEDTARMSTPNTLLNIFVSPSETFQNLRRHPRWLVAALVMTILSTIFFNLFMYRVGPDNVTNFTIDKTKEMSMMNDAAKAHVESGRQKALDDGKNPVLRVGQAVTSFAGSVFWFAFLGGVFFLFALAMGGKMNYWQAFSAAVYASFPVGVIKAVLGSIILFLKDPVDIHPILGQSSLIQDNLSFLVTASDHPVIYTILGILGLFSFYWIWMNATGIKNTGEHVTGSIAWTATLSIFFVGLLLGVVAALLFPGFIS
jgi:hypothetical protein